MTATVVLGLAVILLSPHEPLSMFEVASVHVATVTAAIVRSTGLVVEQEGTVLRCPGGFAMEIYWRCTGLLPAAFLAALILVSPSPFRRRLAGTLAGGGFVLLVNLCRLCSLCALGAFRPQSFAFGHLLWEAVIASSVPLAWLVWLAVGRSGDATMEA